MPQCVVIADDLTGGNAAGVQLRQNGFDVISVLNEDSLSAVSRGSHDCVICSTDSRALPQAEAYRRVKNAAETLKSPETILYAKRIDTTLRGNLGAETDALLDTLGDDYTALAVPTFPDSGRVVVGGYLLVKGTLLHKTDIAVDPKCPVDISRTDEIIRRQSKYKVDHIDFSQMMHGKHKLAELMQSKVRDGVRIISFDAMTQEDLELIADAAISSGLKIAAVDAGVFTAILARKLLTPAAKRQQSRILVTVGSVHPLTSIQVKHLLLSQRITHAEVNSTEILESPQRREMEISRVCSAILADYKRFPVSAVIGDGLDYSKRIDFSLYQKKLHLNLDEVSGILNSAFAEISARILGAAKEFKAIYTSGGDITVAVCKRLKAAGIQLQDEVLPLAAYGTLLGGECPNLHIVTKGGSQGGEDAIVQCVNYLKRRLAV